MLSSKLRGVPTLRSPIWRRVDDDGELVDNDKGGGRWSALGGWNWKLLTEGIRDRKQRRRKR